LFRFCAQSPEISFVNIRASRFLALSVDGQERTSTDVRLDSAAIIITSSMGASRQSDLLFPPHVLELGGSFARHIPNLLFPGLNTVIIRARSINSEIPKPVAFFIHRCLLLEELELLSS
jgi:hypothetical protein